MRAIDVTAALVVLVVSAPLQALAAVAILVTDRGPILFRAPRVGLEGRTFYMYKFRTMRMNAGGASITAPNDARVSVVGRLLRKTKLDELPQLVNVVRGDMAIVGPRPEAPDIVEQFYAPWQHQTLRVAPGLTSPGVLWHHTYGEALIDRGDPVGSYLHSVLPLKLALEEVYIRRRSPAYDARIVARTALVLLARLLGRRKIRPPAELPAALEVLAEVGVVTRPT